MNDDRDVPEGEGKEVVALDTSAAALINSGEVGQQIATAHQYPRSPRAFRDMVLSLATLNVEVAEECSYALPRENKLIVGPSARFAEILAYSWGNCQSGARVVNDKGTFVTAQGVFWDMQRNARITYEVDRRIVNKQGRRFSDDMVGVTANAACSIALRNAVFKGIPKALWHDLWQKARQVAVGDATTLVNRRVAAVQKLSHWGVDEKMILAKLTRESMDEVTLGDIEILIGVFTALKEGDSTVAELFPAAEEAGSGNGNGAGTVATDRLAAAIGKAKTAPKAAVDKSTGEVKAPAATPPPPEAGKPPSAPEKVTDDAFAITYEDVSKAIAGAKDGDDIALCRDAIRSLPTEREKIDAEAMLSARLEQIEKAEANRTRRGR